MMQEKPMQVQVTSFDASEWLNTVTDKAHQLDRLLTHLWVILNKRPGEAGMWIIEYDHGGYSVQTPKGYLQTESAREALQFIFDAL